MGPEPKIWTAEYIESDEGKKRIDEIMRPIRAQAIHDLEIYVNNLMTVLTKKTIEAYDTCIEMAPTIIKDYGVNPLPDNFRIFVLDSLEQFCNNIKLPDGTARSDKYTDLYAEQLNSFIDQVNMDELLRAYGRLRNKQHYRSEKWHNLYSVLIATKFIDDKTTVEVFSFVMENKHLPSSSGKILLLASMVLAMDFQRLVKFTIPQMNECFRSKNGRSFHEKYRDKYKKSPPEIIKKISDALEA